jgi:predicted ferric reductase
MSSVPAQVMADRPVPYSGRTRVPAVRRSRGLRTEHVVLALLANVAVVTGIWIGHGGLDQLSQRGGWLVAGGQLAGLYGALAVLVQLLVMSRSPWLERGIGRDQLASAHRWVGFVAVSLLIAHATLITLGYAATSSTGLGAELWKLLTTYPDVLMAAAGLAAFVAVGVTSLRAARRRLPYETWQFVHLYAYLAVTLAFAHQLANGADFADDPVTRAYWAALHVACVGLVLVFRFGRPVALALRHRARVAAVVPEAPGVVSIHVTGRRFDLLAAEAGQFFSLRFLTPLWWFRSHPFSLSAVPDGRSMRFTVKALGDHTAALQELRPGTRVVLEGPYGTMTVSARTSDRVLLVAGGIGITPLRAILEALPPGPGATVLLFRASRPEDLVFRGEIEALARASGAHVHYLVGRRTDPGVPAEPFTPEWLATYVPDVATRDVYVCGPEAMNAAVVRAARRLGVAHHRIHTERFAF